MGVAGIMAVELRRSGAAETDDRAWPEFMILWKDAVNRGQEIADQTERVCERCVAKGAVVNDLIAGRLTLFEAAAKFRAINKSNPQAEHWLTSYLYPDQPYDLALCRSVIQGVEL